MRSPSALAGSSPMGVSSFEPVRSRVVLDIRWQSLACSRLFGRSITDTWHTIQCPPSLTKIGSHAVHQGGGRYVDPDQTHVCTTRLYRERSTAGGRACRNRRDIGGASTTVRPRRAVSVGTPNGTELFHPSSPRACKACTGAGIDSHQPPTSMRATYSQSQPTCQMSTQRALGERISNNSSTASDLCGAATR